MIDEDIRQIGEIVDDKITKAIKPVNKQVGTVNKKLDTLWEQTVKLTEDMAEVQTTLDSQTETLKSIAVNTKHTSENIDKFNKRVKTLEDHSGIVPPPEMTIIE